MLPQPRNAANRGARTHGRVRRGHRGDAERPQRAYSKTLGCKRRRHVPRRFIPFFHGSLLELAIAAARASLLLRQNSVLDEFAILGDEEPGRLAEGAAGAPQAAGAVQGVAPGRE